MRVNAEHPTCPRCDTVLEEANPTLTGEATCENCGARFTWHTEANLTFHCVDTPETVRPAVTVTCTAEDMNQRAEHEQHAANLRAAWESTDPEWLHDAVMSAAAHLDELIRIEENGVKSK